MHWLFFIYGVCCLPIFKKFFLFPLCMTSVTLCDFLFSLHFCLVFAIVFIWNWRRAIPWVIMLFHSNDPNHINCVTHPEKWCQQCKYKKEYTHCVSIISSTCSQHIETHPTNTLLIICPYFQRWMMYVLVICWFMQRNERSKVTLRLQAS